MPFLRKKRSSTKKIANLLKTKPENWYQYFDAIGSLIVEYPNSLNKKNRSIPNIRSIFFKFLNEAFATDAANHLHDHDKENLFILTKKELIDYRYDLNKIDDLKMLYERFNVFLRVPHDNWNLEVLNLIDIYANKITSSEMVLDKKVIYTDRDFTNFFWILNVNFSHYINNTITNDNFIKRFESITKMNDEICRWNSDSIFSFRTVLGTYRIVRQSLEKSITACKELDKASKNLISNIIKLTENQCHSLTMDEVKKAAYIEYVKNIAENQKEFSNLYKVVKKEQVFPNRFNYSNSDAGFNMEVFYQHLTKPEEQIITSAIEKTFRRVEALRTSLDNLPYEKFINKQIFRLHIFKSNEEYVKYGPLWGINTSGGGYAHVRSPLETDLQMISRPLHNNEVWYETFVYQQKGDTRNKPNKEGGNFRNLGHEVQHSLFYALLGQQGLHRLPSWMVEGAANALGNEHCFKEEADYIKNYRDNLPKIERIINMSYASGADMYYFGSALFRFILTEQIDLLKTVFKLALEKNSKETEQQIKQKINSKIKTELANVESRFNSWLIQTIEDCTKEELTRTSSVDDEQQQYQSDLIENPKLKTFLRHNDPTKFVFQDTIFYLTPEAISRARLEQSTLTETPQSITLSDYSWFKSTLESYVIEKKLIELNWKSNTTSFTESIVSHQGHQFTNRKIIRITNDKDINLPSEQLSQLTPALEAFIFQSVDLSPILKKCFDSLTQQELSDPLKAILEKLILSKSICKDFSKNVNDRPAAYKDSSLIGMLSDAPVNPIKLEVDPNNDKKIQNDYQKKLKKNKALRKLLKENSSIRFTFSDTVFVLTHDRLSRYNLDGVPQFLTSGDFQWFESALELFFIGNFLAKKGYSPQQENIAKLLNVDSEYVSNRQIKSINPFENACLHSMIQEFVLSSDLSDVLKYRLESFGYDPINHQADNPGRINATSLLAALTLLTPNVSLILNSLPTSQQLTQFKENSCDENAEDTNNFHWLLTGGILLAAAIILLAGFFWRYRSNKAPNHHLIKDHRKILSPNVELEKLKAIIDTLEAFKKAIKKNISADAYAALFKNEFSIITNNIEGLLDIVKKGFNPEDIFIKGHTHYEQYNELFFDSLYHLNELKTHLAKFGKVSLNKQANVLTISLNALRPYPSVSNHSTVNNKPLISTKAQDKSQNDKFLRYTSPPVAPLKKISWIFKPASNNLHAVELQAMVDENEQQNGKEPIYANLKEPRRIIP